MKQKILWILLVVLAVVVVASVFFYRSGGIGSGTLEEQPVVSLPLAGPLAEAKAEVSGLAWYEDHLVLLPQYPNFSDEGVDGFLYTLPKADIIAYLDGTSKTELEPKPIKLIAPNLADQIPNFQGFESIGFSGSKVFLTIEAGRGTDMQGYLISGTISADLSQLELDTTKLTLIPTQAVSENHTDESLLVLADRVITFYEVTGEAIVADPVAHAFDFDLNPLDTIPMDNIEYRLTDTALSSDNEFWGINYFFPGDTDLLPSADPIAAKYGNGKSNAEFGHVERLIKFNYAEDGITLAKTAPIPPLPSCATMR